MRYQALKKKTFLAAATFTGIAVLFPVLCMAASENDVQTYTDTDFAMDTVVSETLYTTGDEINSNLTAVLMWRQTFFPGPMRSPRSTR